MFPKAHAVAYVTMAFRIAYFKVHYPLAYYATLFSIRAGDFDADVVAGGERRVRAEMAAIEAKGNDATAKERSVLTCLEMVVEAMSRGVTFGESICTVRHTGIFALRAASSGRPLHPYRGWGSMLQPGLWPPGKAESLSPLRTCAKERESPRQ